MSFLKSAKGFLGYLLLGGGTEHIHSWGGLISEEFVPIDPPRPGFTRLGFVRCRCGAVQPFLNWDALSSGEQARWREEIEQRGHPFVCPLGPRR